MDFHECFNDVNSQLNNVDRTVHGLEDLIITEMKNLRDWVDQRLISDLNDHKKELLKQLSQMNDSDVQSLFKDIDDKLATLILMGRTQIKMISKLQKDVQQIQRHGISKDEFEQLPEKLAEKYAFEKQKLEQKEARRKELEGYLKAHFEKGLLPVIRAWLERLEPRIFLADMPLEYSLLSASAYYHPHRNSVISKLSEPHHPSENIVREVKEHLSTGYPELWSKWISLKDRVNSHLESVVRIWEEIEENVKDIAKELGLAEWDRKGSMPITDYYIINRLVEAIWIDPEYYQKQKRRFLDDYEILPEGEGFNSEESGRIAKDEKSLKN